MFRSKFSEDIFNAKYQHERCETWRDLAITLVDDVCGPDADHPKGLLPADMQGALVELIADLKFIPGGRYLYYAGRERKFFNNCLSGSTRVLTDQGFQRLDSFVEGEPIQVFSPVAKTFLPATAHEHGVQSLYSITFGPVRGNSRKTWTIEATRNHRWHTTRGETTELSLGDVVPAAQVALDHNEAAFLHGLVFADGSKAACHADGSFSHQLRLCGWKATLAPRFEACGHTVTWPPFANGDPIVYVKSGRDLKKIPADESPAYIAAFLKGWVAFDGHAGETRQLHSIDRGAIEFFCEHSPLAGWIVSGDMRTNTRSTNFAPDGRKPLYGVNFQEAGQFPGFKVIDIEFVRDETVYCPYEPQHNRIVIDYGIDTYQCFMLRAKADTREDWADLSWKAENCLLTGGGIGIDYSVYRPSGRVLKGTGGVASGPLPKMMMINEIGRNVMQGGSRRSAIYASLNWRHGDIGKFLTAKNWHEVQVPGTKLTLADLKDANFNWPAPLDMTNCSVNYDTDWYMEYCRTGDPGDVFLKNVEQAVSTGEPGLSFNFFEKVNQTLRNACCELTSEDDSDVCNLGSLNMGRIDSISEFREAVDLATQFLLCGTLRAHLPYQEVYDVREKNRRLGLGLMGMHEWLLKRGYRYQAEPELLAWMEVYRGQSAHTANLLADALGISRPLAVRAIAPTGTTGILAGTSTGIEPIFAVAYKRRYLREGTKWHYQYVVDSAAQELIQLYGLNPDSIESALDLANDYERRIAFQATIQAYVDHAISSTINLPKWGSRRNNPDTVKPFAETLAKFASRLRGFTCYPEGARGGQPLTPVPYSEAKENLGKEFEEAIETHDVCSITGHGGTCGV